MDMELEGSCMQECGTIPFTFNPKTSNQRLDYREAQLGNVLRAFGVTARRRTPSRFCDLKIMFCDVFRYHLGVSTLKCSSV
jgi:hypothetical protein